MANVKSLARKALGAVGLQMKQSGNDRLVDIFARAGYGATYGLPGLGMSSHNTFGNAYIARLRTVDPMTSSVVMAAMRMLVANMETVRYGIATTPDGGRYAVALTRDGADDRDPVILSATPMSDADGTDAGSAIPVVRAAIDQDAPGAVWRARMIADFREHWRKIGAGEIEYDLAGLPFGTA